MDEPGIARLLPGFRQQRIRTSGAQINTVIGGSGPPLLLLHGHPQTLVCWHKVAPALARDFTVVLTDLRGYGDSSKPEGGPDHVAYSKREMARDQLDVMQALGFPRFAAAGHDRAGACCTAFCSTIRRRCRGRPCSTSRPRQPCMPT